MSLGRFLPDVLLGADAESPIDAADLYECRHCGSKFDENRTQCTVCGATEIAAYTFSTDSSEEEPVSESEER